MKRSAIKRKPLPRKRSERLVAFDAELRHATALLTARSGGRCEIGLPECRGAFRERHHRQRRNPRDPISNDLANLLAVCRSCHQWAHAHPTVSRDHGWIVPKWADPRDVAVRRASQ